MHTIIFFPDPEVAENIGQLTSNNMYNASMAGTTMSSHAQRSWLLFNEPTHGAS